MNVIFPVIIIQQQVVHDSSGKMAVELTFDSERVEGKVVVSPEMATHFSAGLLATLSLEIEDELEAGDVG